MKENPIVTLKTTLTDLGLNPIEIKVFLANLELGPVPASNIAKTSGLNRVTAYEALKRLSKKGLVKIRAKSTKRTKYFEAEDIEVIQNQLERKQTDIVATLEKIDFIKDYFKSLYQPHHEKPLVLFYEGRDGIKNVLEDTLKQRPSEILSFVSAESLEVGFEEQYLKKYWQKRTQLKIPSRGIMAQTKRALELFTPEHNQKELRQIKFIKKEAFIFKNEIDIYGDNVSIIALKKGEEHGIIIRSRTIAESWRSMYEFLWQIL